MADNALSLLEQQKGDILQTLPSWITPERWWQLALHIARSPALQRCTRESLVESLRQIAAWGLELDGEEATVIAYGQTATAQAMYKGLIRRVIDAHICLHLYAELVYEGEHVRVTSGTTGRNIEHELVMGRRGKINSAYAVAILTGGITDFEWFSSDDIEAVERAALRISGGKPSPAWQNFRGEMIKKSALRRLCKRLRGKRNPDQHETEEEQRYKVMMDSMQRVDPEPTAPLTPEEMPKAAAPEGPPEKGAGTESLGTAANPPSGRTSTLVDDQQLAFIDENAQSIAIPAKKYTQLMREFGITDEHQLTSDKMPKFLERMHQLASNG